MKLYNFYLNSSFLFNEGFTCFFAGAEFFEFIVFLREPPVHTTPVTHVRICWG